MTHLEVNRLERRSVYVRRKRVPLPVLRANLTLVEQISLDWRALVMYLKCLIINDNNNWLEIALKVILTFINNRSNLNYGQESKASFKLQ